MIKGLTEALPLSCPIVSLTGTWLAGIPVKFAPFAKAMKE
jgi:hypothetical protein